MMCFFLFNIFPVALFFIFYNRQNKKYNLEKQKVQY